MNDCGCEKARRDLEEYLRHEICTTSESDIREHLEHCAACRDEVLLARTLTDAVARACRESAPEDLKVQVLAKLRAAQATH
ncbi:hypothetical protein GCM10027416_05330 [Okibacterium endophyticum]